MSSAVLLQLPLHPGTAWEPTGNIPLAPAKLAAQAGLPFDSVLSAHILDKAGDSALIEELLNRNPEIIAVSLYLWNSARTINLLRNYKRIKPEVLTVAGGPEVTRDNEALLEQDCIDLFVSGEGESFACDVLNRETLVNIIDSGKSILGPVADTSPPDRWPDPYRTGHIKPEPGGSAHIETQRGCSCRCSYCAYRRTSPVPRIISAADSLDSIRHLKESGAGELVFLDPTFNARKDLDTLLKGMNSLDLSCFAEVRGDILQTERDAVNLKLAGFHSLEVGLQTMSAEVLKSVGRGGDPRRILEGAHSLKQEGITPVVDLILGLPGDKPENITAAAEELVRRNLGEQVQTFCLSVLPGTELRANASKLGITYSNKPPYCVDASGRYSLDDLLQTREYVSDILGYDADPPPRPVLCDDFPGLEIYTPDNRRDEKPKSLRHGVIRIVTDNAWENRDRILQRIKLRRETDPFCPLDVVIESGTQFPLDLLDWILSLPEPECYDTRKAEIYDVPSLLRLAVIADRKWDSGWINESSRLAVTVIPGETPGALPGGNVGLLLQGSHDLSMLSALYSQAPHLVFFRNADMERLWNLDVLGLG